MDALHARTHATTRARTSGSSASKPASCSSGSSPASAPRPPSLPPSSSSSSSLSSRPAGGVAGWVAACRDSRGRVRPQEAMRTRQGCRVCLAACFAPAGQPLHGGPQRRLRAHRPRVCQLRTPAEAPRTRALEGTQQHVDMHPSGTWAFPRGRRPEGPAWPGAACSPSASLSWRSRSNSSSASSSCCCSRAALRMRPLIFTSSSYGQGGAGVGSEAAGAA
jgi:hypothetical protein